MTGKTMSMRATVARLALVAALLSGAAGCGRDDPVLAAVRGRVFYKGVALTRGSIVFTPDADRGATGPLARADIQRDGTYALTVDGLPGATPGWYRVSIVALD